VITKILDLVITNILKFHIGFPSVTPAWSLKIKKKRKRKKKEKTELTGNTK
jgi:hypothetical protein